ncbi:MAG: hypothetical protein LBV67_04480 [Streptococcaceae bacterium]|nr:hypothetical protein [Streptococcaceae bacterium]
MINKYPASGLAVVNTEGEVEYQYHKNAFEFNLATDKEITTFEELKVHQGIRFPHEKTELTYTHSQVVAMFHDFASLHENSYMLVQSFVANVWTKNGKVEGTE